MQEPEEARVLVIDDEPELADLYADQLAERFDAESVYSGDAALATVDESYDVALLDRRMPDVAGEDLLEDLRDRVPGIRVAMVTAVVPDFEIIDMDFDDYLLKPVTREELHTTVEQMAVRSSYQELVQEYFTLTSKFAALNTHKSEAELEQSEEFSRLEDRLEEVRGELDSIVAEFGPEDFRVMYRDLP